MNLVYPPFDVLSKWVGAQIEGGHRGFGECTGIGVAHDDRLVAGVIYHNWCPEHCVIEMSAAATDRRWLTRPVLRRIFEYPFDELGCGVVMTRNHPDSTHLHRIWQALGATKHEVPHLRGLGVPEVVMVLTKPAWQANKFNRRGHGQAQSAKAA